MNIEKALRLRYRWPSPAGELTLEQLWQLPLQSHRVGATANLDDTAKEVNRQLKSQGDESFVSQTPSAVKTELEEKLAIVVHVISVRMEEAALAKAAAERAQKKAQLLEILHDRNNEDLRKKTPEELEAMIAEL